MKMMKLKTMLAALALGLGTLSGNAGAAVLTFDKLTAMVYGDGAPLLAGMSYQGLNLVYEEAGFLLTLHAPNAAAGAAHISDGTFYEQTFNWHDGLENGDATFVTLSRAGGGLFNLAGFDYYTDASTVWADGIAVGDITDAGSWSVVLTGISELRLSSGTYNELDNVSVEPANAVPVPGSLQLLLAGLAAAALLRRRAQ